MTAATTTFRRAIRDAIAQGLGIETVVERKIDDALVDTSAVCSWPVGETPNEANRQFRFYSFTVRVLLPDDPAIEARDDEDPAALEEQAEKARAALPAAPVGDVWSYTLDEIEYDLDRVSIDFTFTAEYACGCS